MTTWNPNKQYNSSHNIPEQTNTYPRLKLKTLVANMTAKDKIKIETSTTICGYDNEVIEVRVTIKQGNKEVGSGKTVISSGGWRCSRNLRHAYNKCPDNSYKSGNLTVKLSGHDLNKNLDIYIGYYGYRRNNSNSMYGNWNSVKIGSISVPNEYKKPFLSISGKIKAKTDKNTTYVEGPTVFSSESGTLTFDLTDLSTSVTNGVSVDSRDMYWLYWCKKFNPDDDNYTYVTSSIKNSSNSTGTHWQTTNYGTVYYYISSSNKTLKLEGLSKGYRYQLGVLAYHKPSGNHSNSDNGGTWNDGSTVVSKKFRINTTPKISSFHWTSNKKFGKYTESNNGQTKTTNIVDAWTSTTGSMVVLPDNSDVNAGRLTEIFMFAKFDPKYSSASKYEFSFKKNGAWTKNTDGTYPSGWTDANDSRLRVHSTNVGTSRGANVITNGWVRITFASGEVINKYIDGTTGNEYQSTPRKIIINKLPSLRSLRWSATSYVRNNDRWTKRGYNDWTYNDSLIIHSGGVDSVRMACDYDSQYTGITNIEAKICGVTLQRNNPNHSYSAYSDGRAWIAGWCECLLYNTKGRSGESCIILTDGFGEKAYIGGNNFPYGIISNEPPQLDAYSIQWTSNRYLKRTGATGEIDTTLRDMNSWTNEDMIIPSGGTLIRVSAFIKSYVAGIKTVKATIGGNEVNGWAHEGWAYGDYDCTGRVNQGQIIELAKILIIDYLGESAEVTLSKWTYVNSKVKYIKQPKGLTWTANKYVKSNSIYTTINGGVNVDTSYCANSIIIPSTGNDVTIWAQHEQRTSAEAPIQYRYIWDGGSNGLTWTEWGGIQTNAGGFWATRYIRDTMSVPYARAIDYLGEQSDIKLDITCTKNTPPTLTDAKWTANRFLIRNGVTTEIDTTLRNMNSWTTEDMIIPSGGTAIKMYAKIQSYVAGIVAREGNIGGYTANAGESGGTVTYTYDFTGSVNPKDQIKEASIKVTDALGESGEIFVRKWAYVNYKINFTKIRWTANKFIKENEKNVLINGGVNVDDSYCAESIIFKNAGESISIWAEHEQRDSTMAPIKTRVIKNGGSGGTSWSGITTNAGGFWATKTIKDTISTPYAEAVDYLEEKSTVKVDGIQCIKNTLPVLSNLKWSTKNYVTIDSKSTAVINSSPTNKSIITSTEEKTVTIYVSLKNNHAPIVEVVEKLGSLSASTTSFPTQPTSSTAIEVKGNVTVSDNKTTNFSATATDILGDSHTINAKDNYVQLNTIPTFDGLRWTTNRYITSAGSKNVITNSSLTNTYIITATTGTASKFEAKINNSGANLNTAVFNLGISGSGSGSYQHSGVSMTYADKTASSTTASCKITLLSTEGTIYNKYKLTVKDVLGEGFEEIVDKEMIMVNTKPSDLAAKIFTDLFVITGETTVHDKTFKSDSTIITKTTANKIYLNIKGNKKSGAALGEFSCSSGNFTSSCTLSESSPKSFDVDLPGVTVTATQNTKYTFTIVVKDNLGETADTKAPDVTINTKPSWSSSPSIYINNINNKDVVVSKHATSATILAKTAKTKVGARLKSYIFNNTDGIKPSTDFIVNTEELSASYTFTWDETEDKRSKFTCYIEDVLGEQSEKITSAYNLIVNKRPAMKGSIFVTAKDKDDIDKEHNMMTKSDLYIKTTNNGKTIGVRWEKPTLYNNATVKEYQLYVSKDNEEYSIAAKVSGESTTYKTKFEIDNVHTYRFKLTCTDSYGDESSNELPANYPVYTNVKPYWPDDALILIGGKSYTHYYAFSTAKTSTTKVTWTGAADKGAALSYYRIWNTDRGGSKFLNDYVTTDYNTKEITFKFADFSSEQNSKYKFKIKAYDELNESSPELTHDYLAIINTIPVLTFTSLSSRNYVTNRNRTDKSIIVESVCNEIFVDFKCVSNNSNGLKSVTVTCSNTSKGITSVKDYDKEPGENFTTTDRHTIEMINYNQADEVYFTITATDGLDTVTLKTPFALYNTVPWFDSKPTVNATDKYGNVEEDIIIKSTSKTVDIASKCKTAGAPLVEVKTEIVKEENIKTSSSTVTTKLNASDKIYEQNLTHTSTLSYNTQGESFYYVVTATDELGESIESQDSYIVTINTKPSVPEFIVTADNFLISDKGIIVKSDTNNLYVDGYVEKIGSPLKTITFTNTTLNDKSGTIGTHTVNGINSNSYSFNKQIIKATGCAQGGNYKYSIRITDVLDEFTDGDTHEVLYNTIPIFDKPLVSTEVKTDMIYKSGTSGDIIVRSYNPSIVLKCNNIKTEGASLDRVSVSYILNSQEEFISDFLDCKGAFKYTFNEELDTADYGQPNNEIFYRVTVTDNLQESTTIDSYNVLWNTIPTMEDPTATTVSPYYNLDDMTLVFNSKTKDVEVNTIVTNAGAPLVNTEVKLIKESAKTGSMNSPFNYTPAANEVNMYILDKTLTFNVLPNQGSKWYFQITSKDKLGELVTKNTNYFVINTIPTFSATPKVSTEDSGEFIYLDGKSGNIIAHSESNRILISGCTINTSGSPLKNITFTPVKKSGTGTADIQSVNIETYEYNLDNNLQNMPFNIKPEWNSEWYFKVKATDILDEYNEIDSYIVLWNTPPTLTKPIPYSDDINNYIIEYDKTYDIIVKSTLKNVSLKSDFESIGAALSKVQIEHNIIDGDGDTTATHVKNLNTSSEKYVANMKLTADQGSVHNYTVTITDKLNETATDTSYNVTVNTIPIIEVLLINEKDEQHYILSYQKEVTVSGEVSNAGAKVKSYLYENNVTGTGANPISSILEEVDNFTVFNKVIQINNVSNTKHTFKVTVTDELKESSNKTTVPIIVNTRPYYKDTDKVFINNDNKKDPYIVAHNNDEVTVSWVKPVNVGAEISNYYYCYSTDGGDSWSAYKDCDLRLNDAFLYVPQQDLTHIFKVYAEDLMGERTDVSSDGTFYSYNSNTLLNNTIPWFMAGSTISLASSVPCVLTDTIEPLDKNVLTNEDITIPSTGSIINVSWPAANNKGGELNNYLLYRSQEKNDIQNFPSIPTFTIKADTTNVNDDYYKEKVETAYHYYKLLASDIFYGATTSFDYINYLYSSKVTKNIRPRFVDSTLIVHEANANKIISSEINSITISYSEMAQKTHGLPLKEYHVYISADNGTTWVKHVTLDTTYTFTDLTLVQNSQYKFKIVIYDGLEYSEELVSDTYLINTIPYFKDGSVVTVDGFTEDFDLDYSFPSVLLKWTEAVSIGEPVIGYRIEVLRENINDKDKKEYIQEVDTKTTDTSYIFELPYASKKEFDMLTFRIYAYDSYSDSRTVNSYLESCTITIKGAFQIKRHD